MRQKEFLISSVYLPLTIINTAQYLIFMKRIEILLIILIALVAFNLFTTLNVYFQLTPLRINDQTINQESPNQPPQIQVSADDDPVLGNPDAPVTIIEFSDYQCPFCRRFWQQTLPLIKQNFIDTGKVKLVYRDFPLNFHQYAQKAAEAAECAGEQGKYWEYHDILFERQAEWSAQGVQKFKDYAVELGLDLEQFSSCLDSGKYAQEVQKDYQDGISYGVRGTPTFFINGVKIVGAQPYQTFETVINQFLQ